MTETLPTKPPTIRDMITAELDGAVRALLGSQADAPSLVVERSKPGFSSDFQSPVAMQLAKVLRQAPRQIGAELEQWLSARQNARLESIEVSGPGFLGLRLSEEYLGELLKAALASDRLGIEPFAGNTVVIDYSSPNVAKRMHIGHIRSTVIGDAMRRMGSFLGHKVIADNHIGDWGTQFGQLIYAWRNWRDDGAFEEDPVGELERLYVKFHKEAAENQDLNALAREELRKLQAGDEDNLALWKMFRRSSQDAFDSIYERLGVCFDVTYGESHYNERLGPLVERLLEQRIAERSDGAVCVFFRNEAGEDEMTPFLIQKKDGAALYATTDLATVELRLEEFAAERMIYVTDHRQKLHFEQLFATAEKMGVEADFAHLGFGMMTLPEGAFSTRQGNVIRLDELLDEAERRARATQEQRLQERGEQWSEEELAELAATVGLGALKYADLSNNPQSNIVFSFDRMLSFDGNTAPYLQYTSARTFSLLRKAREQGHEPDGETFAGVSAADRDLLLHVVDLGRVIEIAFDEGKPSVLATWLYELATRYHSWYASCPVLRAERPELLASRLNLTLLCQRALVLGLDLLGIRAPERM
ncbi:MAG: arginine--tRNA ligase [Rickettsiales bacterium]|nr:arginine--tRNA ligase [Rickettsiales bacterium]